jgi:co-chaperonin GroES (HSP10)
MNAELPHDQKLNHGLADIDQYRGCALPDEYEITSLLGNVLMVTYEDVTNDGKLTRNGIVLPDGIADTKAWRVGKVQLAGPSAKFVKQDDIIMFPGDRGLPGIHRGGKQVVFLNEERVFGICKKS